MARALADWPADLWARNGICPPERTIMLAATSKRIRDLLAQLPRQVPARVKVKRMEGLDVGLPRMLKWLSITVEILESTSTWSQPPHRRHARLRWSFALVAS